MNTQAKPDLLLIPLSQLRDSKCNVRKTGGLSIAELADSIFHVGLLQNLNVVAEGDGGGYGVVAGKRRRAALKLLVKQKRIPKDYPVPCRVVNRVAATTVSLTENVQREAMHPADQFDAFARLIAEGRSVEEIAADFAVTPLVVQRRLKLANVSPRLLADYRAGAATLDQLMALAVVDDHAAQEAAFYEAAEWQRSPAALRDHLTADEVDARTDRVARFVGTTLYEAAGGAIRRDLFAENDQDGFIADVALLDQLARDKLAPSADDARSQGWAWVEVVPRAASSELAALPLARRERRAPNAKESKRLAELDAACAPLDERIAELEGIDDEAEQESTQEEYDGLTHQRAKLEKQRDAIEAKLMVFPPEVMALAGAVVTIDQDGRAFTHAGLLRPEDAQVLQRRQRDAATGRADSGQPPERAARTGLSEKLARQLSSHRTAALQIELARQPQAALVALVHQLTLQLLYDHPRAESPVQIVATEQTKLATHAADIDSAPATLALAELRQSWQERLPKEPDALFVTLLVLAQDDLLALLALCVASTLDAVTPREDAPRATALAGALQLDMRNWWTATAESYFGQVSKAKIVEAVGEFAPAQLPHLSIMKKSLMASEAARLAANTGWLPAMLITPQ